MPTDDELMAGEILRTQEAVAGVFAKLCERAVEMARSERDPGVLLSLSGVGVALWTQLEEIRERRREAEGAE